VSRSLHRPRARRDAEDNVWIVGDPETVARKPATLRDEVGGFGTLLVIAHEWRPPEAWERSMTLLRERVLPRQAGVERP
jgi:alkanesulfonate monooxygenase SsuD/methylene tetrahydromethanopterin reductase-like flavin-dependent oxidoreductase (luciferase family)